MWLKDPSNGNSESATLTLWVVSVIACFVGAAFHMMGKVEHTSILLELNWGLAALYLGRRMNFANKNSSVISDPGKKEE